MAALIVIALIMLILYISVIMIIFPLRDLKRCKQVYKNLDNYMYFEVSFGFKIAISDADPEERILIWHGFAGEVIYIKPGIYLYGDYELINPFLLYWFKKIRNKLKQMEFKSYKEYLEYVQDQQIR